MSPKVRPRRFPPPGTIDEYNDACFIVRDHNGQALGQLYILGARPGRAAPACGWPDVLASRPDGL